MKLECRRETARCNGYLDIVSSIDDNVTVPAIPMLNRFVYSDLEWTVLRQTLKDGHSNC